MPLELHKRHGSPNWYMRGTIRGIPVDQSTRTNSREAADAIRALTTAANEKPAPGAET